MGFYGLILGGWASGTSTACWGSTAAQLVSYEVAMGLSVVGVVMMAQSLSLVDIVNAQADSVWYILLQPVAFVIFAIAAVAETNWPRLRPAGGRVGAGRRLPHRVRRPEALRCSSWPST